MFYNRFSLAVLAKDVRDVLIKLLNELNSHDYIISLLKLYIKSGQDWQVCVELTQTKLDL